GGPLRNVRQRVQKMAIAIGQERLGTPAVSAALARVSAASTRESELLAARVDNGLIELPWYAPLVFRDTLDSLAADALRFKLDIAAILDPVHNQSSAWKAGGQLEGQVPILEALQLRQNQLGAIPKDAYQRTLESPAQTKADAVIGAQLMRIMQDRATAGSIPKGVALLANVQAPRLFGRYRYWASQMTPGEHKPPLLAFNSKFHIGRGWGTTTEESGIDGFEEMVEGACQQFGQYRVLVMRMTQIDDVSSRALAIGLEKYATLAATGSKVRHPVCYVAVWGGRAHVLFAPVDDFQALLSAIDFGKIGSANHEQLTLEVAVAPEKIAKFRDASDQPPPADQ
ncbi:MAG TPA: hypothetical protein VIK18_09950, partial [Pirellulales bacterium]